jgi:hypothetical protein
VCGAFRTPITGGTVIVASRNGRYDVTLYKVLEDRNLPHSETAFECTLSLPGTAYQTSQKITYSPGKWQALGTPLAHVAFLLVATLLSLSAHTLPASFQTD